MLENLLSVLIMMFVVVFVFILFGDVLSCFWLIVVLLVVLGVGEILGSVKGGKEVGFVVIDIKMLLMVGVLGVEVDLVMVLED